jgi:phospholipid/cholesterol/gamma-HCH transport system permease protein
MTRDTPDVDQRSSLVETVLRGPLAFFGYLGEVVELIASGLRRLFIGPARERGVIQQILWAQLQFTGIEAIPFVCLLALLTAVSVMVQMQLVGLGQSELFGKLVVTVLVRELGPLLVSLAVLARSGTAIATEIANLRASRELQAIELSGIEPIAYIVAPRLGGIALANLCLVHLFIAVALMGGFVFHRVLEANPMPWGDYIGAISAQLSASDALILAAKTIVPGLLIAAIACREALVCTPAYTEVPRAATRMVGRGLTTIFAWMALITALTYSGLT